MNWATQISTRTTHGLVARLGKVTAGSRWEPPASSREAPNFGSRPPGCSLPVSRTPAFRLTAAVRVRALPCAAGERRLHVQSHLGCDQARVPDGCRRRRRSARRRGPDVRDLHRCRGRPSGSWTGSDSTSCSTSRSTTRRSGPGCRRVRGTPPQVHRGRPAWRQEQPRLLRLSKLSAVRERIDGAHARRSSGSWRPGLSGSSNAGRTRYRCQLAGRGSNVDA